MYRQYIVETPECSALKQRAVVVVLPSYLEWIVYDFLAFPTNHVTCIARALLKTPQENWVGHGEGQGVSLHAFYSDELSSNPAVRKSKNKHKKRL